LVVLLLNVSVSPRSSCRVALPERPVTVTLSVELFDELQVAVTVVFAVMVPLALLLSVQF